MRAAVSLGISIPDARAGSSREKLGGSVPIRAATPAVQSFGSLFHALSFCIQASLLHARSRRLRAAKMAPSWPTAQSAERTVS